MTSSGIPLDSFSTFGDLLKYLRRRARLTQRELSIAVKYSEAQISRLEQNQRPPDLSVLAALFIPSLYVDDEPETIARLMELATQARGESRPERGTITFSRSTHQEMVETSETEFASNNLPLSLNSFIGRVQERADIKAWLARGDRLISLTGVGGCGKTRLAIETARDLLQNFHDGVWIIELASITNPDYIVQAINTALHAPEPRDVTPTSALINYLRRKHVLVLLDNCEQVISSTAQVTQEILRACPHVQILATSREAFNIPGETVLQLQPLSLPGERTLDDSDSTRLFLDRACSFLPNFEPDESSALYIAQICRRLDGIPLAIELAVSRLSVLSLPQIASRLGDRFELLTTGSRTALPRQQTLQAAIDWSYDLLSGPDQKFFQRLCVFSGGFDLDAANAVLQEPNEAHDALDIITRFVEKSLISVDRFPNSENRYRLLETVREYCREKLRQSGEESIIRTKHFEYFLAFAQDADQGLRGKDHIQCMRRLEQEHDNLRAALDFASSEDSSELARSGLRCALSLEYFWFLRGYRDETHTWLEKFAVLPHQPRDTPEYAHLVSIRAQRADGMIEAILAIEESMALAETLDDETLVGEIHLSRAGFGWREDDPTEARRHFHQSIACFQRSNARWQLAYAFAELGEFAQVRQDDRVTARASFEESLRISRELGDPRGMAFALVHLGDLAIEQNKLEEARSYSAEGLIVAGELNDMESMSWGLDDLSIVAMSEGRLDEAERLGNESLLLSQELGRTWHTVIRRYWLARVHIYKGDEEHAAELFEQNRVESPQMNFDWGYAVSLHELGCAALRSGDSEKAQSLLTEAVEMLHKGHYGYSLAYSLDAFAALAIAQAQPERAQILFAAVDVFRESIHTALLPPERVEREQWLGNLKATLSPGEISALTERGRGMTLDEAVKFALG